MNIEAVMTSIAAEGWLCSVGCVMGRLGFTSTVMSNSCDFQIHRYADTPGAALGKALDALEDFARKDITIIPAREPHAYTGEVMF